MQTKDWKWNQDTMGTGVVAIDREHQILVSLLHRMHEAIEDGEGEKVVAGVLDELLEYTGWHFKNEEALFDKYDYPGANNHKTQHKVLIAEVKKLQVSVLNHQVSLDSELLNFMKRWLLAHIQGADFKFVQYLRIYKLT